MSGHTPGPWRVNKSNGMRVAAGRNTPIAETLGTETLETEFANASLIAAAPELLEACKLALEVADGHISSEYGGTKEEREMLAELDPVREAIAKAEGA